MLFAPNGEIKDFIYEISTDNTKIDSLITTKVAEVGEDAFWSTVRRVILHVTDLLWVEHLDTMDYVRSSVNLRAYGQREPLVEYKKEGLTLFTQMEAMFREQVLSLIETIRPTAPVEEKPAEQKTYITSGGGTESANTSQGTIQKSEDDDIGRNDRVVLEKDGVTQEIKYKKAEQLLAEGWTIKEVKK